MNEDVARWAGRQVRLTACRGGQASSHEWKVDMAQHPPVDWRIPLPPVCSNGWSVPPFLQQSPDACNSPCVRQAICMHVQDGCCGRLLWGRAQCSGPSMVRQSRAHCPHRTPSQCNPLTWKNWRSPKRVNSATIPSQTSKKPIKIIHQHRTGIQASECKGTRQYISVKEGRGEGREGTGV